MSAYKTAIKIEGGHSILEASENEELYFTGTLSANQSFRGCFVYI